MSAEERQKILSQVSDYYTNKILLHGATHEGVDWNSLESQTLRFGQLLKVTGQDRDCSVLDYGCGYGAMARYMRDSGHSGLYFGYDISDKMLESAREQHAELINCEFSATVSSIEVDYSIASGIFNVKQQSSDEDWLQYVLDTIDEMASLSRKGFSFNMLTSYSDAHKKRPDLFYGDPAFFIDYCIKNYSRHVAMLHNYGLYEFTIISNKVNQ
jgi:SAM-dependent methyltransferase